MRSRVLRLGILLSFCLVAGAGFAAGQQTFQLKDFKNNLAPNVGSSEHAIDRMLEIAKPKPGEVLYDLGCGDGRILIAAVKRYRVNAVGVEISRSLAEEATEKVRESGLQNRIKIVHGDFMQTDLSPANVVTLYLATVANESLRPNLEKYLRPNTRVISYDYPIPGWRPINTSESEGALGAVHTIYLYEVPNSFKK